MPDTATVLLPDFQQVVASVFVPLLTSPGHWWLHESFCELVFIELKNVRKKCSGGDVIYKI